jgi:hypothetical protein
MEFSFFSLVARQNSGAVNIITNTIVPFALLLQVRLEAMSELRALVNRSNWWGGNQVIIQISEAQSSPKRQET